MATVENFIAGLNKALEWEYAAAVQYVQHAAVITGPEYDAISKELVVHANEELAHAITVAEAISDLGGIPSIEVEKRDIAKDAVTMLEQDLAGEEHAVRMYKGLIRIAEELQEYGIRRILEDILIQEEEHRRDLLSSLGR
ncbi:ferritin-like domain-containing protein [Candidatus Peregrinibacteria bacterium]|jgi:bacterioferritin|nr:ferritin-like domain-containing protein [Candidatus Peregrinibacteria bacterium]